MIKAHMHSTQHSPPRKLVVRLKSIEARHDDASQAMYTNRCTSMHERIVINPKQTQCSWGEASLPDLLPT